MGTTYRQVRSAPKRSEESFEITAFDPPRLLVIEADIGPFQARIGYALETVPEATRLTVWVELEPPPLISRVMVPLAASQIRAAVASNLERLKGSSRTHDTPLGPDGSCPVPAARMMRGLP